MAMPKRTEVARRACVTASDFVEESETISYQRTAFPVTVQFDAQEAQVQITVPTLDAVTADEEIGSAVVDGWFETLQLRLEDVATATTHDDEDIALTVTRNAEEITITYRITLRRPDQMDKEVSAIAQFVEGTYLQGVVPGYEYEDPVASLMAAASKQAGSEDVDPKRGGTPL